MDKSGGTKTARTVALMMSITIIGKILGLLRDRMQAGYLGGGTAEATAFMHASFLPRIFLDIMFAAAFSASFIPVFSSYVELKGKRAAFDLAALFLSITTVLTIGVAIVAVIFARPIFIATIGEANLPPGTIELGTTLFRFMLPLMVLSGVAFTFAGILQSLGEFKLPAAMSIVSNGIIILYYFLLMDRFGVYGLAFAFLAGWVMQAVIQVPFLVKHKFKFRFCLDLKDPGIRQIAKLALPVIVSSWVVPVNIGVNARAVDGQFITALHFANTLFMIISGVFILSVSNVIFPKLSRQVATGDEKGFVATLNETVSAVFFFLVPLTLGLMLLSRPLVSLIFGWGYFGEGDVAVAGQALFFFSIGIVGFGLFTVLSRACFAKMNGKAPTVAAVVALAVNAVLSFALAPVYQVVGVAIAGAASQIVGALVLVVVLTKKGALVWKTSTFVNLVKIGVATGCMFVAVLFLREYFYGAHELLLLGVTGVVGVVVYFGITLLTGTREMDWVKGFLRKEKTC